MLIILAFVIVVYRKFPSVLNLPSSKHSPAPASDSLASRHARVAGYEYHTGERERWGSVDQYYDNSGLNTNQQCTLLNNGSNPSPDE